MMICFFGNAVRKGRGGVRTTAGAQDGQLITALAPWLVFDQLDFGQAGASMIEIQIPKLSLQLTGCRSPLLLLPFLCR